MVTPRELTIREGKVIEEVAKRAVLPPPDSELRVGYEDDDDNAAKPHIVRIRKIPYGIEILQDFGPVEFPQSTTSSPPPIARR